VDSPPRERPSASRPGCPPGQFLSFADAPRDQARGRRAAGASGVLMSAHHSGIGAHRPLLALGLITASLQLAHDLGPGPIQRPAAMPAIDRLPVPEPLRQIPPRASHPGPEEDPIDHLPVIGPPATPRRISGQEPPQALPLLITQVMAIQLIKHRTDLHDPSAKIHGTRPRGQSRRGRALTRTRPCGPGDDRSTLTSPRWRAHPCSLHRCSSIGRDGLKRRGQPRRFRRSAVVADQAAGPCVLVTRRSRARTRVGAGGAGSDPARWTACSPARSGSGRG
jgi:hypothetical protein